MIRKILFLMAAVSWLTLFGCKISGTVTQDGAGLEGVTVTLRGDAQQTTKTDSEGNYSFNNIMSGTYYVSAAKNSYKLNPVYITVTKSQPVPDASGIDFQVTEVCDETIDIGTNYVPCGEQHEITEPSDLLDENGALVQTGWARSPLLLFNPEFLGIGWERAKWWDFYGVVNPEFNLTFFIADLGYMTLIAVSFADFGTGDLYSTGTVKLMTKGELGLSNSSMEGDFTIETQLAGDLSIERRNDRHILSFDNFLLGPEYPVLRALKGEVALSVDPSKDSMVVATSYREDPRFFYYNHKLNLLPATGALSIGGETYTLTPEETYGQFDWGRGVWPYNTHWYWGTGAGIVDGHEVWFNIGYGFGDLFTHTENMIFYDGVCHKIDRVTFNIQEKRSGKPWTFTSNDGRLELTLEPLADQSQDFDAGIGMVDSNNIAGLYSGYLILDDGTRIDIEDMHGHAEDIRYRW